MNQKQQFKLYYGKYTNVDKSYSVSSDSDGLNYLYTCMNNHRRILADQPYGSAINEIKFVIRPSKDKRFLSLFTYWNDND
jgi:hypothetical protein